MEDACENSGDGDQTQSETKPEVVRSKPVESSSDLKATLRVIIVGRSGHGKSSTGNTLLGKQLFKSDDCALGVSPCCQMGSNIAKGWTIVDTPGLCDTETSFKDRALEIQKSIEICKNPHAFLLIFKLRDRITTDDNLTIKILQIIFGDEVFDHCIVVFTHGCKNCKIKRSNQTFSEDEFTQGCDEYQEHEHPYTDKDLESFWRKSKVLSDVVKRCQNRVIRIENNVGEQCHNHASEIIEKKLKDMIMALSNGGKKVCHLRYTNARRKLLENHTTRYDNTLEEIGALHEEMKTMVKWEQIKFFLTLVGIVGFNGLAIKMTRNIIANSMPRNVITISAQDGHAFIKKALKATRSASNVVDVLRILFGELSKQSEQCINTIVHFASNTASPPLLLRTALSVYSIQPKYVALVYMFLLQRQSIKL